MFARPIAFLYAFFALVVLAAATPNPQNAKRWDVSTTTATATATVTVTATPSATPSCSTGPVQCCNSLEKASSPAGSLLLGLLGVVVQGVDVLLGLDCSPISVVAVGGGQCKNNVVCCQNNAVGGLISVGCIPVIL